MVKRPAPARPSNQMVIRIFTDALIIFETYSGVRKKMRPSQAGKQLWRIATPKTFGSGAVGSPRPSRTFYLVCEIRAGSVACATGARRTSLPSASGISDWDHALRRRIGPPTIIHNINQV